MKKKTHTRHEQILPPLGDFDLDRDSNGRIIGGTHKASGNHLGKAEMREFIRDRSHLLGAIAHANAPKHICVGV